MSIVPFWHRGKNSISMKEEIDNPHIDLPHVFLLGAGASLAACPEGDRKGSKLPLMNNFAEVVGLSQTLQTLGCDPHDNFEQVYTQLFEDKSKNELRSEIEGKIESYFSVLELPSYPTVYDYIVLCLRKKDVIATFNWDSFLPQAIARNRHFCKMPEVLFLHGCSTLGFCSEHLTKGHYSAKCPICECLFTRSRLLFPVGKKNYNADHHIHSEWREIQRMLRRAYLCTVYGYSAPESDIEAVDLIQKSWHDNPGFKYRETEIIDIKSETSLQKTWSRLWFSHHFQLKNDFFKSLVACHPRRSCEAIYASTIETLWSDGNAIPERLSFDEIYRWLEPLIEAEQKISSRKD